MTMRKMIFVLGLVAGLWACEDSSTDDFSFEYEETFHETKIPPGNKFLSIQNTNGSIAILGSDTATHLSFEITKRVRSYRSSMDAKDYINDIQVSFKTNAEGLQVTTDHPESKDLDYEVDYKIVAPIIFDYKTVLGNGDISIEGVSRNLTITLGNGNFHGDVILLNDCTVDVEAGNGSIYMIIPKITDASLFATVGNGSITDSNLGLSDRVATVKTLSGIMGEGKGTIILILGNGTVTLEGY